MKLFKKTSPLTAVLAILVFCVVLGLILTAVHFFGDAEPASASVQIQFSFDGAANGLAPNSVSFDISDIFSDEVLSDALAASSLSDRLTPDELRPHIVTRGIYPDNMAEQVMSYESLLNFTSSRELTVSNYHPTAYSVSLYNVFDPSLSRAQLETLLSNIVVAYRNFFSTRYANNLVESALHFDLDQYDYPQQLAIVEAQMSLLSEYAQEMYEKDPSFSLEGEGFNDIGIRYTNLVESDIGRMNANLTMNALTRDTVRLLIQYQYEIRNLNNQLEKKTQQLKSMDSLIDSYQKNEIIYLSTSDSLIKIDGNSSETYDSLVDARKEVADEITQINSDITTNQLKISDLISDTSSERENEDEDPFAAAADTEVQEMTAEELAAAAAAAEEQSKRQIAALESSIANLLVKRDEVTAKFKKMLQAYNEQHINELTVSSSPMRYNAPRLFSGAFIKSAIKTAGPVCSIGFMVCMVILIADKKAKKT